MAAARSPFPGMDPWLERHWRDVHHEVISDLRRQIEPQLPDDLFAVVEENVYLVADPGGEQTFGPDVGLYEDVAAAPADRTADAGPAAGGGLAVSEPVTFLVRADAIHEGFVEIRQLTGDEPLVTAVEVLSPTNKRAGPGRAQYVQKRQAYVAADVSLLEIDLLRAGRDLTGVDRRAMSRADPRLPSTYRCAVRRPGPAGAVAVDLYPVPLRERLPNVRVPLRPGDPGVVVDLQRAIDAAYRLGRYGRRLDYGVPPVPPLSADDAAWAAVRLAAWRAAAPPG